jgi:hypothetical protein
MKVAYEFAVMMAMMVALAYAVKWGRINNEPQIPSAPTCKTVQADKPEYQELLKACKRIVV